VPYAGARLLPPHVRLVCEPLYCPSKKLSNIVHFPNSIWKVNIFFHIIYRTSLSTLLQRYYESKKIKQSLISTSSSLFRREIEASVTFFGWDFVGYVYAFLPRMLPENEKFFYREAHAYKGGSVEKVPKQHLRLPRSATPHSQ
jgi:hypothetical protein